MNIDEIAQKIIVSFNAEDSVALKNEIKMMLHQIDYDESMFSVVKHPYAVAKSLYFMLTQDYLSEDNQISCIKLAYFCLLKNYLDNKDKKVGDLGYEELVSGCKLALVLISMQNQYLMYSVIAGQCGYINPQTHIRKQVLLFGGIAKEAKISRCDFRLEDIIKDYFTDIIKELYDYLPTGRDLAMLKDDCTPVIKNLATTISINLKEMEDWG